MIQTPYPPIMGILLNHIGCGRTSYNLQLATQNMARTMARTLHQQLSACKFEQIYLKELKQVPHLFMHKRRIGLS